MGRKKKYLTDEEKYQAQLRWAREYYERNKELIDAKSKDRYHASRNTIM
jgi:hypothetical protein